MINGTIIDQFEFEVFKSPKYGGTKCSGELFSDRLYLFSAADSSHMISTRLDTQSNETFILLFLFQEKDGNFVPE